MKVKDKASLADVDLIKKEIEKREILQSFPRFAKNFTYITDKLGNKVNLVLNTSQEQIEELILDLQSKGIPPRLLILKARQMGISTYVQGRIVWKTATTENRNALVIAHLDDSTRAIFKKAKYAIDNLPDDIKPLMKSSNAKEFIFDKPRYYKGHKEGLNSRTLIQTAGGDGYGRSDTYHYVHLSEFAFWQGSGTKSPDKQLSGILQSVPDIVDTLVVIESTANGMNAFKDVWDKAVSGEIGFIPVFLPWYQHKEYEIRVLPHEAKEFKETMSEYELWLYNEMNLPLKKIKWWRETKKNKCNNDINQMKQENPTTPEEAFIFSGRPVFNLDNIQKRISTLRRAYKHKPYKEGYFAFKWHNEYYKDYIVKDSIVFIENSSKPYVRIYFDPTDLDPYIIGADTKGEGRDSYAAQVVNNVNRKRVATLEMQVNNSKPFAWQLYCLGNYYNKALIGVEMNFNTAPIEELERLRYPNQYVREKVDDYTKQTQKKLGFKTDGITRPRMIDNLSYLVDNHIDLFQDIKTLRQMTTFVYDTDNRPDAMAGAHDDLLISDAICTEIRTQQSMIVAPSKRKSLLKLPDDLKEDIQRANGNNRRYLIEKYRRLGFDV